MPPERSAALAHDKDKSGTIDQAEIAAIPLVSLAGDVRSVPKAELVPTPLARQDLIGYLDRSGSAALEVSDSRSHTKSTQNLLQKLDRDGDGLQVLDVRAPSKGAHALVIGGGARELALERPRTRYQQSRASQANARPRAQQHQQTLALTQLPDEEGELSILELLDADRQALDARLRILDLAAAARRAAIELDQAIGREFRP